MGKKIILAAMAALLLAAGCGKSDEYEIAPLSDNRTYNWEGSYIDEVTGNAVLTIEKGTKLKNPYEISIYIPSGDGAFSLWTCTADYDADLGALSYTDCTRIDVDASLLSTAEVKNRGDEESTEGSGETEAAEEPEISRTAYYEGSGSILVVEDTLLWLDDMEDRGSELRFQRVQEPAAGTEAETEGGS